MHAAGTTLCKHVTVHTESMTVMYFPELIKSLWWAALRRGNCAGLVGYLKIYIIAYLQAY